MASTGLEAMTFALGGRAAAANGAAYSAAEVLQQAQRVAQAPEAQQAQLALDLLVQLAGSQAFQASLSEATSASAGLLVARHIVFMLDPLKFKVGQGGASVCQLLMGAGVGARVAACRLSTLEHCVLTVLRPVPCHPCRAWRSWSCCWPQRRRTGPAC